MTKEMIGKEVKFSTKKGFFYQGRLVDLDSIFITIIDRKKGLLKVKVESIEENVEVVE